MKNIRVAVVSRYCEGSDEAMEEGVKVVTCLEVCEGGREREREGLFTVTACLGKKHSGQCHMRSALPVANIR